MKKTGIERALGLLMVISLTLMMVSLTACGKKVQEFDVAATPKALMEAGAFSEDLEELEEVILLRLYEMDESKVSKAAGFASTGLTAEEVAVFQMVDETAAQEAEALLQAHLEYQKESNVDYRPNEMPKLDKAVVERRGKTLLFLVANDYAAAGKALEG